MVDHLDDPTLEALGGEGEGTEHDEAEVGHRRVGDQALEVALHGRHHGPVDDADDPERHHQGSEVGGGLGEEVQPEAEEPVGPQLEHHPGQDDRAGSRGLGMSVGQPGVEREHRDLDGEGHGEGQEQPPGSAVGDDALGLGQHNEVEGQLAGGLLVQEGQAEDPHQHEGRAQHGEQEELEGGVHPLSVAPAADEEVHRHQHDLEHHEEKEQVQGEEYTDAPGLQQQHPGQVGLGVVMGPHPDHGNREQQAGEHDQEQRDPVHAEVPGDAELLDPGALLGQLEAGVADIESDEQRHAQGADHQGRSHPEGTSQLGPTLRD